MTVAQPNKMVGSWWSIAKPVAKALFPAPVREWAVNQLSFSQIQKYPCRIVLVRNILPTYAAYKGRILWIGCRHYTRTYPPILSQAGGECWTTDIEPSLARWGAPGRHLTWDITRIDRILARESFDTVLCNGVFGFGVNAREAQGEALEAIARILKPGGRLLLGWNTDRCDDPRGYEPAISAFAPDPFPFFGAHYGVPGTTHVYDFMRRAT